MSEDKELRLEEQDLRLLKNIINNAQIGIEFANSYDHSLFVGDANKFAKIVLDYIKTYRAIPTKRVLLDNFKSDQDFCFEIDEIWDSIQNIEVSPSEYRYDLDKIKSRYTEYKVQSIKDILDESTELSDLEKQLRSVQKQIDDVKRIKTGQKQSFTQKTLRDYMPEYQKKFAAKANNPNVEFGILTGYSKFDWIKRGLQPAEMLIIGAETAGGKALPLDTLIPTPNGFKKMGDIHIDDEIFGRDGKIYKVLAESEIFIEEPWKFIFSDGAEMFSHSNHEWLTFDRKEQVALSKHTPEFRKKQRLYKNKNSKPWLVGKNIKSPPSGTIRTTKEIIETLYVGSTNRYNHAIPICSPLELPKKELLIDPYVFGAWLGDGTKRDSIITSMDKEIISYIEQQGYVCIKEFINKNKDGKLNKATNYRFSKLRSQLRQLNVYNNKHIPDDYLWSSKEQRLALVQGLMDTDGFVSKKGQINFVNTNKNIIDGLEFLINSLGEKCTITEGKAKLYGKITGPKWTVRFSPSFPAFKLSRKLERQQKSANRLNKFRYIVNAEKIKSIPMKCIQVSSPDNLYLCGKNFIPTHNSMLLNNMAIQMWMQTNTLTTDPNAYVKGYNVLYFSLEMPYDACARRTLSRLSKTPNYALRDAKINTNQAQQLNTAKKFILNYPYEFEIVDIPRGVTAAEIELRFLDAMNRYHPDIVVVDYLGLMESSNTEGDDWLKLGHIAGQLHELARMYNVVMMTAVQLNRPSGQSKSERETNKVGIHRVGRSSLILHHADLAIQIETRPDEKNFSDMMCHIIKNRDGELGEFPLKKDFKCSTVEDQPWTPEDSNNDTGGFQEDLSAILKSMGWHN